MTATGPGSAHRHKTRSGAWYDLTDVASGSTHTHELDTSAFATTAALAVLEARVAALEGSPPTEPPPSGLRVTSIGALLEALADDTVPAIVVADGTYRVSPAAQQKPDSLWIGSRYAARATPVSVRAETLGGVTFDGGGAGYFGAISFVEGAHDQTWSGFRCANGRPTQTGVIVFGGYAGLAAPHHITLRDWTLASSLTSTSTGASDHGVYFSEAVGGPHDLLVDGLVVDGAGGLDTALHFYHSDAANLNAWNVTIRRMAVSGTDQAVMFWDATLANVVLEDSTITGAGYAVRYEVGGSVILRRVRSSGSRYGGFYSSLGPNPPGIAFIDCDLR